MELSRLEKIRTNAIFEYLFAAVIAVVLVLLILMRTNTTPPRADAVFYVDMAKNGILGNSNLVAPFAYRPGMPFIVHLVSKTMGYTVEEGFRHVGIVMGVGFLISIFALARLRQVSFTQAVIIMAIMSLSFQHIKFPLYFYTLVDIAAYPLIVTAFLFLITKRYLFCALISLVGLLFKEFLVIPWILVIFALFVEYKRDRSTKSILLAGVVTLLGISIILIPRIFISVVRSAQSLDPINDITTLQYLINAPLSGGRTFNIVFSVLSYWMPSLFLMNSSRLRNLVIGLKKDELFVLCSIFVAINMLLVLYGGTNILLFVSYMAPVQALILAYLFKYGVETWEILYTVFALILFNKILLRIPLLNAKTFDAYIDFYGGFSTRVNEETIMRFLLCVIYIVVPLIIRYVVSAYRETPRHT
jgi:hypothetical protein